MAGNDLRIYWGDARVILHADDPRTPKILALIATEELRPPKGEECVAVPATDTDLVNMLQRYFTARRK